MGITVNEFINAIAYKLKNLYPDYDVYADEIKQEQELSNYFFIYVINASQSKKLGTRCQRIYNFDIFYFQPENENINFFNWIEKMMTEFKYLQVGNDLYHVTNIDFTKVDDVGHFTFGVKFYTLETEDTDKMEKLILNRRLKDG